MEANTKSSTLWNQVIKCLGSYETVDTAGDSRDAVVRMMLWKSEKPVTCGAMGALCR